MGITHQINEDIVEIIVQGQLTIEELLSGFRRVLADDDLPRQARVLINVTASDVIPSVEAMHRIAAVLCSRRERVAPRLAVLVTHAVRFGKARQLGAMLEFEGLAVQPFYDRSQALLWLLGDGV